MGGAAIEVDGLRKRFGSTLALDGMTFTVRPGQITGFVGPNGAGQIHHDADHPGPGRARAGHRADRREALRDLRLRSPTSARCLTRPRSAQPHRAQPPAVAGSLPGPDARQVDEVIERAGLRKVANRKAGGFSLGMRQRLGIAAALLGDPPVLILDEPFNGMDPEGIVWMRGFLAALAAQGRAVLVSSHLMSELEDTANHLIVVGRGKVIADTSVAALIASASRGSGCRLRTTAHAPPGDERAGAGGGDGDGSPAATPSSSPGCRQSGSWHCSARTPCHSPRSRPIGPRLRRPTWS